MHNHHRRTATLLLDHAIACLDRGGFDVAAAHAETAICALWDGSFPVQFEMQRQLERRLAERRFMIFPVVASVRSDEVLNVAITDLSECGCGIAFNNMPASVGDEIELNLGECDLISGRVIWISRNRAGIEFNSRIDAHSVDVIEASHGISVHWGQ